MTSTSSLRPDIGGTGTQHELSRTDYTYDGDGNISETAEWTRVGGQGDSLDGSNAVRTRTVNWYDAQKRLIATAELGTEDWIDNQWVFIDTGLYTHDPEEPPVWDPQTLEVNRQLSGLPDSAMLWFSVFDVYGNLTHAVDPAGVVTENQYSNTGRLIARIDNAAAPTEAEQRRTEYVHQYGRVVGLKATRAVAEGPDEVQYSGVRYEAQVVDETFASVSGNNALASALGLLGGGQPHPETGEFPHDLEIRYTFAGQIAERIDARHVSFRYRYDALGRVDSIEVGHYPDDPATWAAGYPASMTAPNGQDPADRVGYLDYLYDDRGGLAEVATYDRHPASGGLLITHNHYDYSDRGEILADWQAQGQAVDPLNTPHTAYAWDYAPTDPTTGQTGRHRLASMLYPAHDASQPRDLYLAYGTPGSDDDSLSRITSIASSFGSAAEIATFDYVGVGRRYRTALADQNIVQTFKTSMAVGLVGLDMFGRPRDLRFENALFETLFVAQYTYDANGNRLAAELTQAADAQGAPQHNIRSQLNAYDGLNRLVGTEVGSLVDGAIDPGTLVRDDAWNLDLLGNWSGGSLIGSADPGRVSSGNLDGYGTPWALPFAESAPDNWEYTLGVDDRNQLTLIKELDIDAGTTTRSDTPVYDAAGSLIFDGNYYFQYDAWNRLVQVNEATDMGQAGIVLGDLVKHYLYDGLGRLVRTQSPAAGGGSSVRTERFYYDGLRRIQEFVTEPLTPLMGIDGDPTLEAMAEQTVSPQTNPDAQSAPTGFEQQQLGGGIGGGAPSGSMAREYVWGPGDSGPGFDELLVQYDENGEEAWAIQDAGGDLVALCDLGGGPGGGGGGTPDLARVVGQWTFDAYGEVLTAEHLFAFALPHLGHKGLFLDRLDGDGSSPRLVPFGHTLYHMRNRTYAPGLGRFLQRDPNQTAMALAESAAMHGRGLGALSLAFDLEGLYGDGGNLYEYLGSNPWARSDPLGLSWDPFDMVDEYLAEDAGSKAAFLERVIGGAATVAYIATTIISYSPVPLPIGVAAYMAADALEGRVSPELAKARKILGYVMLTGFVAKIGTSATMTGIRYVQQYGMRGAVTNLWSSGVGIAKNAWALLNACGCFEAGTGVWTARGFIPIEEVREGDQVLARDEVTGETVFRRVLFTYIRFAAPIVEVAVVSESGGDGTLRTTEEHPFYIADRGWVGVTDLRPGDIVDTANGEAVVRSVVFTGQVAPVYNLEVEGVHDYFVGEDGVLVHNGLRACWLWAEHHLIPVYMGGWRLLGSTERLYNRDHVLMHRLIDDAAREAGAPLMNEGRKAITVYLRDNGAQGIQTLKQVLIKGVGAYDQKKGTDLLSKLLNELAKQGW